jgi:CHAT domain-containing protein/tetratricopeptide (TPR) repeat protein
VTGRIACLVVAAVLSAGGRAVTQTETLADAYAQYDEALKLYEGDEFAKAASMADRSLATRERLLGPDDPDVARSLALAGRAHRAAGELGPAQTLLERALQTNEHVFGANDLQVTDVLIDLSWSAIARADYPAAERAALRALQIRRDRLAADDRLVGIAERTVAEVYIASGAYGKTEAPASRALEIARRLPASDRSGIEAALTAGRAAMAAGHFDDAERLIQEANDRAGGKGILAADVVNAFGFIALRRADNVKAEELFRRVVTMKERLVGPTHPSLVGPLGNLAVILYRRRNYQDAEPVFARALAIQEKATGPNHPEVGRIVNNMGLMAWQQKDYSSATELFRRSLEIQEHFYGPESREVAGALGNLGIMAKETGDYKSAESSYQRALTIAEKLYGAEHVEVRQNLESLAILRVDQGNYDGAEPLLKRALAITSSLLGPLHPDAARELRNLARLEWARERPDAALAYMQRETQVEDTHLSLNLSAGSEREKLAFFGPVMGGLDKSVSFYLGTDPDDAAARDLATTMLLRRKGRVFDALADSLGAVRRRSTPDDLVLLDQLASLTSELATLVLNGPQRLTRAEHAARVDALTVRRESIEAQLNNRTAGYERADATTLAAVEAAVPPHAALVEFVVYAPYNPRTPIEKQDETVGRRYAVCVIVPGGTPRWKDLGPADAIDAAVAAFRAALRDPKRSDVRALGRALDRRIGEPVRALSGAADRLLVSADGQLDLVPFEALVDERGRYLVERLGITYLTSGRDLLRLQTPRPAGHGLMIVAAPQFGEPETVEAAHPAKSIASSQTARRSVTIGRDRSAVYFAPLIGTQVEAQAINALFPRASMLVGARATESAIKQADAPEILHIATHGFFLEDKNAIPNPLLRSGLALAGANRKPTPDGDGVLTALEASGMNLWGTRLVTLSACDTGVGEVRNGEGVYGLRRAFFLAGAETIVMSLWPVSDSVTREIMTGYYRGLRDGLGRGEALRRVELSMIARADRRHPFYWASFVQAGEWANLSGKR